MQQHERNQVIANAGRPGVVTIATNMAGELYSVRRKAKYR